VETSTTPATTVPLASGTPASGSNTTAGAGSALSGESVSACGSGGGSGGIVLGSDQAASASEQAPPAPAVVGAVLGGLAVGVALVLSVWVLMLRRRKAALRRRGPLSGASSGTHSGGPERPISGTLSAPQPLPRRSPFRGCGDKTRRERWQRDYCLVWRWPHRAAKRYSADLSTCWLAAVTPGRACSVHASRAAIVGRAGRLASLWTRYGAIVTLGSRTVAERRALIQADGFAHAIARNHAHQQATA